ncbi:MAG: peptide deformylase [Pseudomonadota bacterium]
MAIRKVARLGHPVLRQPAVDVAREDITGPHMRQLIVDMWETMHEYGGVGLAAPQIHESVRVAVIELDGIDPRNPGDSAQFVLFNPRIQPNPVAPLIGTWEGCLSVPGMRGYVERPSEVRVDYLDEGATPRCIEIEGFLAVVFQHELDHLDGVVYVDRLKDPKLFSFNEEFSRYQMVSEAEVC